jgi:hypothetical protein
MRIVWIKLRLDGQIEREHGEMEERQIPSMGDGVLLGDVGYEVVGRAKTPHLDDQYHIFVHEHG